MRWPELLALIVIIESIAAAALEARFQLAGGIPWAAYYIVWLSIALVVAFVAYFVWLARLFWDGEPQPTRTMIRTLRGIDPRTITEVVVPVMAIPAFLASHTTFKALLPHLTTYSADPWLAELDAVFGVQPWQVTHFLFGEVGTMLLDFLYLFWFSITTAMLFAVLFAPRLGAIRGQVLLTFVICWIVLGAGLALLVPSVGPCFYGAVYPGPDPYAPLMERLHATDYPVNALRAQAKIWGDHVNGAVGFGSGISAMPSMHISVSVITALMLARYGLGWLGLLWVLAQWIGSIHLGWHYATDGLVSALVTVIVWRVIGRRLRTQSEPVAPVQTTIPAT